MAGHVADHHAGLMRERGNCEIYEDGAAVTQIRH